MLLWVINAIILAITSKRKATVAGREVILVTINSLLLWLAVNKQMLLSQTTFWSIEEWSVLKNVLRERWCRKSGFVKELLVYITFFSGLWRQNTCKSSRHKNYHFITVSLLVIDNYLDLKRSKSVYIYIFKYIYIYNSDVVFFSKLKDHSHFKITFNVQRKV